MIVVAGLTPAWQQILRFERLGLGEVNRAAETHWCASGKVLNVAVAATRLGGDCRTICPVGGPPREAFDQECEELDVAVDWIVTREPTRVCTTIIDSAAGRTTELVENARALHPNELRAFHEAYRCAAAEASVAVLTGSLPAETPTSFYRELAEHTSGRIIIDARGPELLAMLEGPRKPTIVKPNREELGKTVGRTIADDAHLHAAMRTMNGLGAEWVVVSAGPDAVWASTERELWKLSPPRVEQVVNPIGCGDCLAAGIAVALDRGAAVIDAIRYGIAAAVDNLGSLVPARVDRRKSESYAGAIPAERIE